MVKRPGLAAVVITAKHSRIDERVADVVLDEDEPLAPQVDRLMVKRLVPFARALAGIRREEPGPPVLRAHDPQLLAAAQRMLERLRGGLTRRGLDDGSGPMTTLVPPRFRVCGPNRSSTCRSVSARCRRKAHRPTKSSQRPVSRPSRAPGQTHRAYTGTG